jgi:flavin reductase (DIM6/NTAB) family NADH-FMN oxidoreductase RutF
VVRFSLRQFIPAAAIVSAINVAIIVVAIMDIVVVIVIKNRKSMMRTFRESKEFVVAIADGVVAFHFLSCIFL